MNAPYTLHHEHNGTHIRDAAGGLVASLESGSQEKRDRDGDFLLRACNSHEALVEALTMASAYIDERLGAQHYQIRAALKLAKGEV